MQRNILLVLLPVIILCIPALAQTDYDNVPEVTDKILINDVYIKQYNPDTFLIHDILISKGIIEKISREIKWPVDARIIEGDSMYAYPAFIDAFSHSGIPEPERSRNRPDVKFKGFPPNDVAGITPEKMASHDIKADDKSLADLRKNGFAIAHSVPRGNMLPGQGCIVSLKGESVEDMLIKESSSALFQLEGARGVYPSTVIAVMTKWRELLKQAEIYQSNWEKYRSNPVGSQRPKNDVVLEALLPVVNKERVVFSHAQSSKDVYRSMVLSEELAYPVVLANVERVEAAVEKAKSGSLAIVLSASLPKELKDKKKKDDDKVEYSHPQSEELLQRKKESIKEFESQAALLEKEGIPFAFSMMDAKAAELKDNIRRMMDAGLSEQKALNALTIDAARMLGIETVTGSLDKGKLGNLFISTAPYFEKESSIKYSIIEGHLEEYEIRKKKEGSGKANSSLIGTWSFSVDVMGDLNTGKIIINDQDGKLEVDVINDDSPDDVTKCDTANFEDGTLRLSLSIVSDGVELPVSLVLDIEDDAYTGTASIGDIGSFPIEGSKISTPEK